jgi:hypothetical protein
VVLSCFGFVARREEKGDGWMELRMVGDRWVETDVQISYCCDDALYSSEEEGGLGTKHHNLKPLFLRSPVRHGRLSRYASFPVLWYHPSSIIVFAMPWPQKTR